MSAPILNKDVFKQRLRKLYQFWEKDEDGLGSVKSFVNLVGRDANAKPYSKSNAFQMWLYTLKLEDTLTVATKDKFVILGSGNKAKYFESVVGEGGDGLPAIEVIHRNKANKDVDNFAKLIGLIKDAGSDVGCFTKDKFKNEFVDSWEAALKEAGVTKIDLNTSFTKLLAVKDSEEIALIKNAASVSVNSWENIKKVVVELIDKEKKKKMSDLAEKVDESMNDPRVQGALAKKNHIDNCYSTIMQSGGAYSFKWSTSTSDSPIHFGAITTSLGARFENYCSNLARTLLVQPSKELEEAYESVLAAELKLIEALKPGTLLKDAHAAAVKALKPELRDKLFPNLGFLTGIEFREGAFSIAANSEAVVKAGMVFIVSIGVSGLAKADSKKDTKEAAILLSDTILVSENGPNVVLTEKSKSRLKSNMVRFNENVEEEEEEPRRRSEKQQEMGRGKRSVVLTDQTRNKTTNEEKRREHQKELGESMNATAKKRLAEKNGGDEQKRTKKSNVSYKSLEKFPTDSDIRNLSVFVDKKHDTVILPIFGVPVPFHIAMIKNCSQSDEGDCTYLRINFTHPGSQVGKDSVNFPNPLAEYLKEVTYRASNLKEPGEISASSSNLSTAYRLIKEMQKKFRTEEAEEREKEGAVKQDKLILSLNKVNPKMKDLFLRPNIISKKISGSLEAHTNGFRYTTLRGDKIDVLYNNVKHAFYQPCDNEMLILLHFHLKHPVMWGKKKYEDIQFYTEVGEVTTDLGKYHHMQDRDDIKSEQMEREMRRKLNETFKSFAAKVERQTNEQLDFDSPFNELGFMGTPHRSNCILKPTSSCLVNLTEWPPFVVTLEEVELVHLERVNMSLKNFDMVFIFKDYHRKTQMISSIPKDNMESIKEWLNSCDIWYTEGVQSLNWPKIMKHITDDPESFFDEEGGWSFLGGDSDADNHEESSSEDEGYSPEGSSGSDESDSDESEIESEATDDDDEEGSLDSDESSGKDWSDLEEEAERDDRRRERDEAVGGGGGSRDKERDRKRHGHHSHHKGGPPSKKRR